MRGSYWKSALALCAASAILIAGCGGGGGGGNGGSSSGNTTGTTSGNGGTTSGNPSPGALTISPTQASVAPGGTLTFSASVADSPSATISFSANGGTITQNGVYTAPTAEGTYTVTAKSGSSTATATVTVVNDGVSLTVSPNGAVVPVNGTLQFTADVTGVEDKSVTWSASAGTVSASGLYTPPTTLGTYNVTARSVASPTHVATVPVRVVASGVSVTISPENPALGTREKTKLTANVTGSSNTAVTWTASGGTVDASGNYTAPATSGAFVVRATSVADPTRFSDATVRVNTINITLSPASLSLNAGSTQQFAATVTGPNDKSVTWRASGGTVSATGLYTAPTTPGTYTVIATSVADTSRTGTASVTVVKAPYFTDDLESGTAASEWTIKRVNTAPSGAKFLGPFDHDEAPRLAFTGMPSHSKVLIAFDLYVLRAWSGETWTLRAAGDTLLTTTFSNVTGTTQAYPSADSAPGAGAVSTNTLGYTYSGSSTLTQTDAVYHFSYTINHSASSLNVDFIGALTADASEKSWGIDNVKVTLDP